MSEIKRVYVDAHTLRMLKVFLRTKAIYFIPGSHSIWIPSRKEKWINSVVCQDWPDLHGEVLKRTPSEAARIELSREFEEKKVGWRGKEIALFDWRPPMHYGGYYKGQLTYIDIVSCYAQIYRKLWLNVAFPRGKGTAHLGPVYDRLVYWKMARNSVIGITIARRMVGFRGSQKVDLRSFNPFLSPHLWATIQAILHDLGEIALSLGARYIMTDGFFFPDRKMALIMAAELDRYGVKYRITGGNGEIKGWGAWSIDGVGSTKPYKTNMYSKTEFSNIRAYWPGDRGFLTWWSGLKE